MAGNHTAYVRSSGEGNGRYSYSWSCTCGASGGSSSNEPRVQASACSHEKNPGRVGVTALTAWRR